MPLSELYCPHGCLRRSVTQVGEEYRCSGCGSVVEQLQDQAIWGRSPDGRHNPSVITAA